MFIAGVIHDHEDPCHPRESPDDPQHYAKDLQDWCSKEQQRPGQRSK